MNEQATIYITGATEKFLSSKIKSYDTYIFPIQAIANNCLAIIYKIEIDIH